MTNRMASLLAVSLLSACVSDDAELGSTEQGLEESSWWTVGPTVVATKSWSSGKTSSLSGWKSIDCSTWSSQGVLRDLRAYKEPSGNADNFIARLDARCAEHTYSCANCPSPVEIQSSYTTLYSGNYRTGSFSLSSTSAVSYGWESTVFFPAGLALRLNSGKDYVKSLSFHAIAGRADWIESNNGYWLANLDYSGTSSIIPEYSDSGSFADLDCGNGRVATGLKLRYDVTNGKIRDLQVQCRDFDFVELY
jgi:hypothetical protein